MTKSDDIKEVTVTEEKKKRVKFSQTDFPQYTLERSLDIIRAIWDNFGGKSAEPLQIAMALELSPTSSTWKMLAGSAIAYGLTEGGYGAKEIILTPLGRSIVGPTAEGEDDEAKIMAVLQPSIMRAFFEKYDKAKLPSTNIGANVLHTLGVPKDRTAEAFEVIIKNGNYTNIIVETKTGPYVRLSVNNIGQGKKQQPVKMDIEETSIKQEKDSDLDIEKFAKKISSTPDPEKVGVVTAQSRNIKVFISHGKNKEVVEQLKEIIKFGKYEPVVSVENESLSKSVPDKVMDDMRSCFAGIINVHNEGELLDTEGNSHIKINDNVLIEIGAAMALYGRNYILLVQKGVELPSNLQGLYRCDYEGEKLDYDATMKLLKTFNQFSQ